MQTGEREAQDSLALLRHARLGEGQALGILLERLRPWLRVLAQQLLREGMGARIDASDVVQQTCLSVHRRMQQFQGDEVQHFIAWVREIHQHNIQDEIRRHALAEERAVSRERAFEGVDLPAPNLDSPERPAVLRESALLLSEAVEHLPPAQRRAVASRYLEGRAVSDIAAEMRISPDAVTSLLRRGLTELRRRLKRLEP